MEIKKVGIPLVKPVGGATPTPVQPVTVAVKPVGVTPVVQPTVAHAVPVAVPVAAPVQAQPIQPVVEEEKPKGELFGSGSVADIPKEERLNDVKSAVNKVQNKKAIEADDEDNEDIDESDENEKKTKSKKKVEDNKPKFVVPLKVRIYDREVFVVDDASMTEDQIRIKAADEYGFFEFDKERTKFIYNDAKNEVVLKASFEKRG